MTPFMRMRERIRNFIRLHETGTARVGHGLYLLIGLFTIAGAFPFASGLNRPWLILAFSALGVFMPLSAEAFVLILFLLINLFALSGEICLVTLLLLAVSYLFCGVYQVRKIHTVCSMIVARLLSMSCVVPMAEGLLGTARDVVAVCAGTAAGFFLQEVHANSGVLVEGEDRMATIDFLRERILGNPMFYVYLVAMAAMFLVVYAVRTRNIRHAWVTGVFAGTSVEFLIMLSGYLFIGSSRPVGMLIASNLAAIAAGLIIHYLYQDLDYSRIEKVQFEDDEYYYYVTAVPKIRLTEEKKEVRHIHKARQRRRADEY